MGRGVLPLLFLGILGCIRSLLVKLALIGRELGDKLFVIIIRKILRDLYEG